MVPASTLWALGIGIGFFLIFGFAAWLAVPARVCNIEHQYIGTATGLMLTLAAVGGFFIPIIFGHLVSHTSFDTGWVFLAIVSFAFALLGLAGRNPATASKHPGAGMPTPAQPRTTRPSRGLRPGLRPPPSTSVLTGIGAFVSSSGTGDLRSACRFLARVPLQNAAAMSSTVSSSPAATCMTRS